jgi:hypothetical protein
MVETVEENWCRELGKENWERELGKRTGERWAL